MTKLIYSALVATVLLAGVSGANARPAYDPAFTDQSDRYGGHGPNTQEGVRAFWENQTKGGGR